jgi:ABC-type proline/glycine betaine transport system permease subunit
MLLVEAWQFIVAHPDRFFGALLTHVALSAAALALATAIALPTGVLLAGTRRVPRRSRLRRRTSAARRRRWRCSHS